MAISLDKIIPYQPHLPLKPSQPFKANPLPSKPRSLIHPLPQKPHSRDESPSCPNHQWYQPQRDSIPSPVIEETICQLSPDTNVFDRALEVWSNMADQSFEVVDITAEDMGGQQDRSSDEDRTNNLSEPPPDERSRRGSLQPANHDETRPEALAAFTEPAQQVRLHKAVAEIGRPQRRGTCASQNTALLELSGYLFQDTNAGQPSDVQMETACPAVVNMSHASSLATTPQSADTPTRSPSVAIRGSLGESPVIVSVPDQLDPNALPSAAILDGRLPALRNEEARTVSIAGFVEEIPTGAAHGVTAEMAHCSELRTPQICKSGSGNEHSLTSSGADSPEAVPTDLTDPANTNTSHASSWDMAPQSAETTETVTKPRGVHVRDFAPESQAVVGLEGELDPSCHSLDTALGECLELEAGPTMQVDDGDRENSNSPQVNGTIKGAASNCSRALPASPSCAPRRLRSHVKSTVAVVIPTAPPTKPRASKPTRRSHRASRRKRKYRSESREDSDDPRDSDDGGYIDTTPHANGEGRPTKKSRQPSITDGDQSTRTQAERRSGSLALPDLRTIAQGTLTCEVFPDHILYLFSWTEKRETADHQSKEDALGRASRAPESRKAREIDSGTIQKAQGSNEWTEEEKARLRRLVEEDGLSWPRIKKRFPRRTQLEIKSQYDKMKTVA